MKFSGIFWLLVCLLTGVNQQAGAQVGINNPTPDSSAILDLKHDSRGLLIPRMDQLRKISISRPAHGLMVYDTDFNMFFHFTGTDKINSYGSWNGLSPWRFPDNLVVENRHVFLDSNVKNIGIGNTTDPRSKLTLIGNMAIGKDTVAPENGLQVEGDVKLNSSVRVKDTVKAKIFEGFGTIPVGGIIMWSGNPLNLPEGWELCTGEIYNGIQSPDLRGRFIVGFDQDSDAAPVIAGKNVNNYGAIHNQGGSGSVTLDASEMPVHTHDITHGHTAYDQGHTHPVGLKEDAGSGHPDDAGGDWATPGEVATRTGYADIVVNNFNGSSGQAGGGQAHENRPPYYVLAFIIRTQ